MAALSTIHDVTGRRLVTQSSHEISMGRLMKLAFRKEEKKLPYSKSTLVFL
jgi:hypothetical protein